MTVEFDFPNLGAGLWIDEGQCAATEAHDGLLGFGVIADVVGIGEIIDLREQFERSIVNPAFAVAAADHDKTSGLGNKDDALRLLQNLDGVDFHARNQVDHFDGVVAKRRHEQPPAFFIHGHVVDPAFHSFAGNDLFGVGCWGIRRAGGQDAKQKDGQ